MAVSAEDLDLQTRIKCVLLEARYPISYGALAREVKVVGPGAIARLTTVLEQMMYDDAAAGRPFLAALCEGKISGGLPALGFFQLATALGRYSGPSSGPLAVSFVQDQRRALWTDQRP
jgi:hypothetical protein